MSVTSMVFIHFFCWSSNEIGSSVKQTSSVYWVKCFLLRPLIGNEKIEMLIFSWFSDISDRSENLENFGFSTMKLYTGKQINVKNVNLVFFFICISSALWIHYQQNRKTLTSHFLQKLTDSLFWLQINSSNTHWIVSHAIYVTSWMSTEPFDGEKVALSSELT